MPRNYDWDAPAKLFHWPSSDGGEEGEVYPTLRDAIEAADGGDASTAWVITQNGDILTPGLIQALREAPQEQPRRRGGLGRSIFGWARAA